MKNSAMRALSVMVLGAAIWGAASACTAAKGEPEPERWAANKGSALVVMDMQVGFMPIRRSSRIFAAVQGLVAAADAAGATVVWVYTDHEVSRKGTPAFEVAPPLAPAPGHLSVTKVGTNAFSGTGLIDMLAERGVGRVVFCGLASDGCVKASVESAVALGYKVVVAEDAHTVVSAYGPDSAINAMNVAWRTMQGVELLPAADVRFDAPRR